MIAVAGAAASVALVAAGAPAHAEVRVGCVPDPGYTECRLFDYSGMSEHQSFVVPEGVTSVRAMAWGGGGGGSADAVDVHGGGGAFVQAELPVVPYDILRIDVGGGGERGYLGGGGHGGASAAGSGGAGGGTNATTRIRGGGGGGATMIDGDHLPRTIIAGGGGGAAYHENGVGAGVEVPAGRATGSTGANGFGGAGGVGYNASYTGVAGTPTAGGAGGVLAAGALRGGGGGGGGFGGGGGGASSQSGSRLSGGGGGGGSYVHPSLPNGIVEPADGWAPGGYGQSLRDPFVGRGAGSEDPHGGSGRVVIQWRAPSDAGLLGGAA